MNADTVTPPQGVGMILSESVTPPQGVGMILNEWVAQSPPVLVGRKRFNVGAVTPRRLSFDDVAVTPPPATPTLTTPPPPRKQPRRLFQPTPHKVAAPLKLHPLPRVVVPPPRTWTSGFQAVAVKWNQKAMDTYFYTSAVKYMR